MRGRLIAVEGGEGSGKTTQAAILAGKLGAVLTREPGGTRLGELLRDVFLDPALCGMDARAEVLLMAAQRAEHVVRVVQPALDAGRWVVTDRYSGSTLAYQGYGRDLPVDAMAPVLAWAARDLWPDLNVLLEVDEAVLDARCRGRRDAGEGAEDRLESENASFHRRVADGYRSLASQDAARWVVLDGSGTVEQVASQVLAAVAHRLGGVREL